MGQLKRLLSPENIVLNLEATSKKRVFEKVGLLFENNLGIAQSAVFDALFEREKLGSTGIGQGVAIPHGRIKGLRAAKGAFVRLMSPVPFESPDAKPVSMLFVLLVPEHATELHLQILSELAELFSDRRRRDMLATTENVEEVRQIFSLEREPA